MRAGGRCRREVGLRGREGQEEGFQELSLHRWKVGRRFPQLFQGLPDRRCCPPHPGNFPADVDLQTGIRRGRKAVRGAEVSLRSPPLQARRSGGGGALKGGEGSPPPLPAQIEAPIVPFSFPSLSSP